MSTQFIKTLLSIILLCSFSFFSMPIMADWKIKFPTFLPREYQVQIKPHEIIQIKTSCCEFTLTISDKIMKEIKEGYPQHWHFTFLKADRDIKDTKWVYIEIPTESYKPELNVYNATYAIIDPNQSIPVTLPNAPEKKPTTIVINHEEKPITSAEQPIKFMIEKVEKHHEDF